MEYDWITDLKNSSISDDKINQLRSLVDDKKQKGYLRKCLVILISSFIVVALVLFVGVWNLLNLNVEERSALINGIIAIGLAVVSFSSPIKVISITAEEVNKIIDKMVTTDIMEKIHKTVEQKASRVEKWLALVGACGVFASLILKLLF